MRGGVEVRGAVHGVAPLGADNADSGEVGFDEGGGGGGGEDGVVD